MGLSNLTWLHSNTGIGYALAQAYLSRPNTTVIGCLRDLEAASLRMVEPAQGSKLILVKIEATSVEDYTEAIGQITAAGITELDVVIAVAGTNPASAFAEVKDMDVKNLRDIFDVNTFSFVSLFKATYPLLKASAERDSSRPPKLMAISSNASQIMDMEPTIPVKVGVYGASKAALNYLVRRVHFENPWLLSWVMNPGFVQTDTGNTHARLWGMEKAPHALEDIIPGLVQKVDEATRAETSGNFYNFDGTPLNY